MSYCSVGCWRGSYGAAVCSDDLDLLATQACKFDSHAEEFVFVFVIRRREGVLVHENKLTTGVAAHACELWKLPFYDGN